MKKQKNKAHILFRFVLITAGLLFFAIAVVVRLFYTTVIDASEWNRVAQEEMNTEEVIAPERGNILSSSGTILACNRTAYNIFLDLRHFKIPRAIPWKSVDSLADSLDLYYPRRQNLREMPPDSIKKYSWRTRLYKELEKPVQERSRSFRLVRYGTLADFDRVGRFPFVKDFYLAFNLEKKSSPYYNDPCVRRQLPYGSMAKYSIGRVFQDTATKEWHGYSGLEKDLDKYLYGTPGLQRKVTMTRGVGKWVTREPVRGYDVLTTIDIDIQDILEEELLAVLEQANAEWGTAMVMEVKTGEIKAISNLERIDDGYGEAYNRITECYEPGSVIKTLSLMLAFEDGLIHSVNDVVDCSPFQGTSDPHAPTVKTVKQVLGMSSNTGTARILFRGYAKDPSRYYDRLKSIGFLDTFHTGIAEERIPDIKKLLPKDKKGNNITMTARLLDLARQTFGYNTAIPPLYTLSIYNAIANGGRYVRPHLLRGLRMDGQPDSIFPVSYIRDRICSEETAAKMRECLHEVVWGKGCTGRMVQDDRVEIAGKTGTAFPTVEGVRGYDKSRRRYAFAGFYPYDNPMYSCIVLILAPAHSGSAASLSGGVLKNVALKLYARGMLNNHSSYVAEPVKDVPVLSAGGGRTGEILAKGLKLDKVTRMSSPGNAPAGIVPSVIGMDVTGAIRTLESRGLNVLISGTGLVSRQSIPPGTRLVKGKKILLILD